VPHERTKEGRNHKKHKRNKSSFSFVPLVLLVVFSPLPCNVKKFVKN